jgi:hypothetical protein
VQPIYNHNIEIGETAVGSHDRRLYTQYKCCTEGLHPWPGTRVSAAASVTAAPEGEIKALRELTKDDYNTFLEEAGDTLVVVDFYTDW